MSKDFVSVVFKQRIVFSVFLLSKVWIDEKDIEREEEEIKTYKFSIVQFYIVKIISIWLLQHCICLKLF